MKIILDEGRQVLTQMEVIYNDFQKAIDEILEESLVEKNSDWKRLVASCKVPTF